MFNRSYQIRSRAGSLVSVEDLIQELVERTAEKQSFYQPDKRISPVRSQRKPKPIESRQLELRFPHSPAPADADKPLFDLFPEAYEK
jgi:hypothetical protein